MRARDSEGCQAVAALFRAAPSTWMAVKRAQRYGEAMDASMEAAPSQRGRLSRHRVLIIVGVLSAVVVAMCVCFVMFIFGTLRNCELTRQAVGRVAGNATVQGELGAPLRTGWLVSGSLVLNANGGKADLNIPVAGPRGRGTIHAVADKLDGRWSFHTLQIGWRNGTRRLDLLEGAGSPTQ